MFFIHITTYSVAHWVTAQQAVVEYFVPVQEQGLQRQKGPTKCRSWGMAGVGNAGPGGTLVTGSWIKGTGVGGGWGLKALYFLLLKKKERHRVWDLGDKAYYLLILMAYGESAGTTSLVKKRGSFTAVLVDGGPV